MLMDLPCKQLYCPFPTKLVKKCDLRNYQAYEIYPEEKMPNIGNKYFYDNNSKFKLGFSRRLHQSNSIVYYLCEYIQYHIANNMIDTRSNNLVLAFKNGNTDAINYIANILSTCLPYNCALVAVPSSKANRIDKTPTQKLIEKIVSNIGIRKNIIDASDCLNRIKSIAPAHLGGNRSIDTHYDSIELTNIQKIQNMNVFILDDIVTTGTSFVACQRKIQQYAKSIAFFAVGRTIDNYNKRIGFILDIDGTLFDTENGTIAEERNRNPWSPKVMELAHKEEPIKGAKELIQLIKTMEAEYRLVTSAPKEYAQILASKLDVENYRLISYESTKKHKPFPQPYMRAKQGMCIYEPLIIVIGNQPKDILPAQKLGMTSVLIGKQSEKCNSNYVFSTLEDCVAHFNEIIAPAYKAWTQITPDKDKRFKEPSIIYAMNNCNIGGNVRISDREKILSYVLAFSDISGFGEKAILKYKDCFLSLKDEEDAYQLYNRMKEELPKINMRYLKSISNITMNELHKKICDSQKSLIAQRDQKIDSIFFVDSLYKELFAKFPNPPLFFFYKGNKHALQKKGIAILNPSLKDPFAFEISKQFSRVASNAGWNIIIDSPDEVDKFHVNGSNCILVQIPPLNQVQNHTFENSILENDGCIISLSPIGNRRKMIGYLKLMNLQIALSRGIFAFGYNINDEYDKRRAKDYNNLLKSAKRLVACYHCSDSELVSTPSMKANNDLIDGGDIYALNIPDAPEQKSPQFLEWCDKVSSLIASLSVKKTDVSLKRG